MYVSTNNVYNINGVKHNEGESGTDKNSWVQVVTDHKKASRRQNYPQIGE
jgi:hypothetical protein